MFIRFVATIAVLTSVLFATPAWPPGVPTDWAVLNTTLNVRYTIDKIEWRPVTNGMLLPNKSWIDTGPRGRITLNRGTDTINLSPGTYAGIFNLADPHDKTVVFQQSGSLSLDINHETQPKLLVTSPYFIAVVRGTKFGTSITKDRSQISVAHGMVEVTESRTGEQTSVTNGQAAVVDPGGVRDMFVEVPGAPEKPSKMQPSKTGESESNSNHWTPPQNPYALGHADTDGRYDENNFAIGSVAKSSSRYFQASNSTISFELFILSMLTIPLALDLIGRKLRSKVMAQPEYES